MTAPLILTLAMDQSLFAAVNALRSAHFPRERNFLPAHITLFHHLPGEEIDQISRKLQMRCDQTRAFDLHLPTLRFLGRGVAIRISAPPLLTLRTDLAKGWNDWLTPQDRQSFAPHVTIQNKADPATARTVFDELSATWSPLHGQAIGLLLWWYRGGPWEAAGRFDFQK